MLQAPGPILKGLRPAKLYTTGKRTSHGVNKLQFLSGTVLGRTEPATLIDKHLALLGWTEVEDWISRDGKTIGQVFKGNPLYYHESQLNLCLNKPRRFFPFFSIG